MRPSRQMRRISVSTSPTFTGQVREVFHQAAPTQGQRLAARLIQRLPACPIPEIARLGQTLRKWKDALDDYFDTGGASNGSTEAINGHYRAGQTHRQRLPQPHQLPTPNAPHRRRSRCLHPHSTLKSHQTVGGPHPRPPCPSAASRSSSSNTPEHGMYNESSVLIREPHSPVGSLGDASHPSLPRAESSVIGSTVVYLETSNEDGVHTIFRWSVLGRCH